MFLKIVRLILSIASISLLVACGGGDNNSSSNNESLNNSLTVNAGEDRSVKVNETITIKGIANDNNGEIVTYEWKEGDKILATTDSFEYLPTTIGTYILTLTVTDDNGVSASDSLVVTVTNENDTFVSSIDVKMFNFYKKNIEASDLSKLENGSYQLDWDWGHMNLIYLQLKVNKLDELELVKSWNGDKGFFVSIQSNGTLHTKVKYNNNDYVFRDYKNYFKEGNIYNLIMWTEYGITIMSINENMSVSLDKVTETDISSIHGYEHFENLYPISYVKPTLIKDNQNIEILKSFSIKNMDKYFTLKSSSNYPFPDINLMKSHIEMILNGEE